MERSYSKLGFDSGISNGPLIIKNLFDDTTYGTIIKFLNERVPYMSVGLDTGNFVREYAHNVPFFVNIHNQLTDFASEKIGIKVKPSYSFLSMYKDNGICPLHIDRPQCRYTIDYLIRQDQEEPWPIHIGDHMTDDQRNALDVSNAGHPESPEDIEARINVENWHTVELQPNDAVMYSGTHSWHYRSQRLKGTADLVFFHFVPEEFDGPLD